MKGKEAKEVKIPKITIKQEVIDKSYNSSRIIENKDDNEESAVIYILNSACFAHSYKRLIAN